MWLEAFPEGSEGDGPLEFAGVFADEEGEVFLVEEAEVWGEGVGDPVDGAVRGPIGGRGEFLEPCAWGGEDELAALGDEVGETGEEGFGVGEAAEEIGGVDEVERAEVGWEVHGVAAGEGDAVGLCGVGETGGEGHGEAAFVGDLAMDFVA